MVTAGLQRPLGGDRQQQAGQS